MPTATTEAAPSIESQITPETVVLTTVAFKEPTGSSTTYTARSTVKELGIEVVDAPLAVPTAEEMEAALREDNLPANRGRALSERAFTKLSSKYLALSQGKQSTVGKLREALIGFLRGGGIPNHPIDNSKYQFGGEANSLTVTAMKDDSEGRITGTAGGFYIMVSGSAVWGE